ncbi:MAG: glycerophosphodiester phosphodiesterase [Spirochaetales bacterium]
MMYTLFEEGKIFVLGHRGCSERFPENTMPSFEDCTTNPRIDGVELDVQLTKDGKVVISHDFHLKRTAGLDVLIKDLTYDELKDIDVGSFKDPSFSNVRIPLLEDLFSSIGNRFVYDIEIKAEHITGNKELCLKVWDLICAYKLQENVMVSSFNPFALRRFNRACWYSVPTADIFSPDCGPKYLWDGGGYKVSGSSYMKPRKDLLKNKLRRRGQCPIIPWTVNTEEDARELLSEEGVIGLIGNDPHMLARVVEEKK